MTAALSAATEAYQAYLEGCRAHPLDDELAMDLIRARREMDLAWLNATTTMPEDT